MTDIYFRGRYTNIKLNAITSSDVILQRFSLSFTLTPSSSFKPYQCSTADWSGSPTPDEWGAMALSPRPTSRSPDPWATSHPSLATSTLAPAISPASSARLTPVLSSLRPLPNTADDTPPTSMAGMSKEETAAEMARRGVDREAEATEKNAAPAGKYCFAEPRMQMSDHPGVSGYPYAPSQAPYSVFPPGLVHHEAMRYDILYCNAHVCSLVEVLRSPEIVAQLKETKFAREGIVLDKFLKMLGVDQMRAWYGPGHNADRTKWKTLRDFVDENAVENVLDALESDRTRLDMSYARLLRRKSRLNLLKGYYGFNE
ncbi:hypothetical protein EDD22DRAFT_845033 [Suillus occidentalis]|nr:hypothetical protein EDD22DRAFT_845033 [Suillus occidentalis]